MSRALLLPLLIAAASCVDATNAGGATTFQTFWSEFRTAALSKDAGRVAALTQFPFKTKGTLDSGPVRTYDAEAFRALLPKLLETDSGLSAEPETMLRYIEKKTTASADGDSARVGSFRFEKTGGKWRFTQAYVEE